MAARAGLCLVITEFKGPYLSLLPLPAAHGHLGYEELPLASHRSLQPGKETKGGPTRVPQALNTGKRLIG